MKAKPHHNTVPPSTSSRLICAVVIILIILVGIGVLIPTLSPCRDVYRKARTVYNTKQVGIALMEFDSHYDHYPQKELPKELRTQFAQQDRDDSNYLLGHLIRSKMCDDEHIFEGDHSVGLQVRADGNISSDEEILRAGECAFSYVSSIDGNPSSLSYCPAAAPIVFTHVLPGTDRLDPNAFNGEGVYLRGDNSVGAFQISKDGRALVKGTDLFETGPGTIWGDRKPKIHYPLPYKLKPDGKDTLYIWTTLILVFLIGSLVLLVVLQPKSPTTPNY